MDTKEKQDVIGEIVFEALFIAILWVPLMYYDFYLSHICGMFVSVFLVPLIGCAAMSVLFVSQTPLQAVVKGGGVLVLSIVQWKIFVKEQFIDRAMQRAHFAYDGLSAGGSFGLMFIFCIFLVVGLVSLLVGATLSKSEENDISEFRKKRIIQNFKVAAILLSLFVAAIVGHCLVTWPEYVFIYG